MWGQCLDGENIEVSKLLMKLTFKLGVISKQTKQFPFILNTMKEAVRGQHGEPGYSGKGVGCLLEGICKRACQPKKEDVSTQGHGVYHDDTGSSCHTGGGATRADEAELRS